MEVSTFRGSRRRSARSCNALWPANARKYTLGPAPYEGCLSRDASECHNGSVLGRRLLPKGKQLSKSCCYLQEIFPQVVYDTVDRICYVSSLSVKSSMSALLEVRQAAVDMRMSPWLEAKR